MISLNNKLDLLTRCYCGQHPSGGGQALYTLTGGLAGSAPKPGQTITNLQRKTQATALQQMSDIEKAFAGYTPAFYQKAQQDYVNAQMPQLSQQYQQARNQTQFGLANRGLQQSSAGERMGDTLANQFATAKMGIADQGQQYANTLQQQIENYRQQLTGQVQQAINPSQSAMSFLNAAAGIQAPNANQAIANSMGNFAQQYLMANLYSSDYPPSWSMPNQSAATPYGSGQAGPQGGMFNDQPVYPAG